MKFFSMLLMTAFSLFTLTALAQDSTKTKMKMHQQVSGKMKYSCPMHPDVKSDKPGKCSKCGMDLVKTEKQDKYVCPMHPDVKSDKPGKCSKCGMDLVKAEKKDKYVCPMHADVHSDKPGKCSKCGMDLVKKKEEQGHH